MARRRKRRPDGPSDEDRGEALRRAQTMLFYGLVAEIEPPWTRDQIEAMGPAELRYVLASRPELPTASTVAESLEVVEGLRRATVFWERQSEAAAR